MLKNSYTNSFLRKTDRELNEIVNNPEVYHDEAREAARAILDERMGITPIAPQPESIEEEPEDNTAEDTTRDLATESSSLSADAPELPELHSKTVITTFCLLFSTMFGAVLLMYNLKRTKQINAWYQVLSFIILFHLLSALAVNYFNLHAGFGLFFNLIGAFILTEGFWNHYLGKDLKYRKRSWVKPAAISFALTCLILSLTLFGM